MASGGMVNVDDKSPVSSVLKASSGGVFDSSGWTVATSGSKASGSAETIPQWALYAAAAVAALFVLKRIKRG